MLVAIVPWISISKIHRSFSNRYKHSVSFNLEPSLHFELTKKACSKGFDLESEENSLSTEIKVAMHVEDLSKRPIFACAYSYHQQQSYTLHYRKILDFRQERQSCLEVESNNHLKTRNFLECKIQSKSL